MLKQLLVLFVLSAILAIVMHLPQLSHAPGWGYRISYVLTYSVLFTLASLILALIPRFICWVLQMKKLPSMKKSLWIAWIIVALLLIIGKMQSRSMQPDNSATPASVITTASQ